MAIGTVTGAIERINTPQNRPSLTILTLTCTAGAAGGAPGDHLFPATVINTLSGISDYDLRGLKLYSIVTVPGTTGPLDNSDITITDRYGADDIQPGYDHQQCQERSGFRRSGDQRSIKGDCG